LRGDSNFTFRRLSRDPLGESESRTGDIGAESVPNLFPIHALCGSLEQKAAEVWLFPWHIFLFFPAYVLLVKPKPKPPL